MKRLVPILFAFCLLSIPATGFAQDDDAGSSEQIGITGTVQIGPSLFFGGGGPVRGGIHLDLYPGYEVVDNLAVELNLGFRTNPGAGGSSSYIPVLVPGVRYEFDSGDALKPYVHGHAGLALGKTSSRITYGGVSFGSASSARALLTFNYGGGVNYWINETVGFGGGVTARHYIGRGPFITSIDVDLGVTFKF